MVTGARYETVLISRTGDLVRLLPEWWALWSRTPGATPFQSPAWLLPWWKIFHPGTLMTVAVRRDGRLVGLAPFYLEDGFYGRRLLPLGIGITDYLDVLIDGAPADDVGGEFANAFGSVSGRWDVWSLEELRPEAAARALAFGTCLNDECAQSAAPVLALPSTQSEWAASRGGHRWRRAWTRVLRHDHVAIVKADNGTASGLLETVIDLHARRWGAKGEPGVLADADVRSFHRAAVPHLLASRLLRLFALQWENRTVATYYGFVHRGEAYAYLNGFDPNYAFESPGTALIGHAIQDAIESGCLRFHFLRGQEPYKYLWGAKDQWNVVRSLRSRPVHRIPSPANEGQSLAVSDSRPLHP